MQATLKAVISMHTPQLHVSGARWQVTLCDPTCHVISRSGMVKFTNCYTLFTLLTFSLLITQLVK